MPAQQRGSAYRTARGWGVRWLEHGRREHKSGFSSKTEALNWWDREIAPRVRRGMPVADVTLREHAERYLRVHGAATRTKTKLREDLGLPEREPKRPRKRDYKTAIEVFGERTLRDLEHARGEIVAWVGSLPETQRPRKLRALSQVFNAGVDWERMFRNPASGVKAAAPRAAEVEAFADTEEVDLVADEIGADEHGVASDSLVVFASETGLRPEEWWALERRDIDLRAGVVLVRRAYTVAGGLKHYGKTDLSRRAVPLSDRALEAHEKLTPRIDTPLLFATYSHGAGRGVPGHAHHGNWAKRHWRPALRAAGLERDGALWLPKPYVLRHTFATWALEAGFDIFELSRLMGTSVAMIDRHYGHLARGHAERARERLNRRPSIIAAGAADEGSR
jgi:integrase